MNFCVNGITHKNRSLSNILSLLLSLPETKSNMTYVKREKGDLNRFLTLLKTSVFQVFINCSGKQCVKADF